MTHNEVISRILATYKPVEFQETCDGFKYGNPEEECTGIVTTCQLTVQVIREAARLKSNLVIVHEPSFYTHNDDTQWLAGNPVFEAKKKLLDDNRIVVWRDHDHMHRAMDPDEIMQGVIRELGWMDYVVDGYERPLRKVCIPPTTLRELVAFLQEKLHLNTGRVVGNMDAVVSNIVFASHVFPTWDDRERNHTLLLSREDVDVLIPGELIDWSVTEYARDAEQLGLNKAIIQTGHFSWEEPGMIWLARRLDALFSELPVTFVRSGDPYHFT